MTIFVASLAFDNTKVVVRKPNPVDVKVLAASRRDFERD